MKKLLVVLFGFIMTINLIPVAVLGAWEVPKLDLVQSTCVAALSGTDFRMTVQAENYNVGGEGVGFHVVEPKTEPEIANGGSGQIVGFQPAEWLCYDVTVPVSGEYRIAMSTAADYAEQSVIVSVDGKELAYKTVPSSGGWAVYKEEEVLLVNLTAGSHTIKFENNSWGYNYDYFVIETLTAIKPTAFIFGGHMAEPGGTVNRGFDVIEVEFNNAFTAMPAQKNIKFSDSAGRPLPFDLKSSEKAVTLILKQSMAYGMTYTLSFTGLKDAYGNTVAGENYCFTACAIGADSGTESMVMGTSEIQDDTLNLSGRLLGSRGQGMAGRGIQIAVKNPDGSVLEVVQDASITKEDGIFDATYILPADAEIGLYQVLVGGLYMPESEKSKAEIYHVLSGDETTLLTELAQASTVSNIAKFFKTNEQKLGLSVTASLSGITDTKLVYQRFLGVKFEGVKQLRQRFFEIVALERLNQATKTETIQKLLGNQKDCAVLNIDGGKINYLPTSQKQVLQALLELERIEETEQVSANYNAIMDQFYRLEYQKQDLTMDIASQSAYAGQSVPLKIKLSDNASDLQSLTLMYRLTGGGTDILKKVTVKSDIA
ncbi:MAG: CBM35 domain-containing protein, partial [Anaerovorax sp.]